MRTTNISNPTPSSAADKEASLPEDTSYRLMKLIEANPEVSQRQLAREMGISLGKANYCLNGLIEKGLVKVKNFRNSRNKLAYAYLLTPKGVREKARVTARYLERRLAEFEQIRREIEQLQAELKPAEGAPKE